MKIVYLLIVSLCAIATVAQADHGTAGDNSASFNSKHSQGFSSSLPTRMGSPAGRPAVTTQKPSQGVPMKKSIISPTILSNTPNTGTVYNPSY